MNRAERRRAERAAKKYAQKKFFTKQEVEEMNETAYNLGVEHALEAANLALGIGEKRQQRIKDKLPFLQKLDFEWRG